MTLAHAGKDLLLQRVDGLRQIPTVPAVLAPLLNYLEQPIEQLDVQKVTDLLAQDKSLAAQCLQMANSSLYGRWQKVESLRNAVVSLGFRNVSDIAMSCSVLNMLPGEKASLDPIVFWEHSLGCALVCRTLARKIKLSDPGKAYLAGLFMTLESSSTSGSFLRSSAELTNLPSLRASRCTKLSKDRWDLLTAIAGDCLPNIGGLHLT